MKRAKILKGWTSPRRKIRERKAKKKKRKEYELALYEEIRTSLNSQGFNLEIVNAYWDLEDNLWHMLIEVKVDNAQDGAAQLLYGIGKAITEGGLEWTPEYLGLVDRKWFYVYKNPKEEILLDFVGSLVPNYLEPPSKVGKVRSFIEKARMFLHNKKLFSEDDDNALFLTKFPWREEHGRERLKEIIENGIVPFDNANVFDIVDILLRYGIEPYDFIAKFTKAGIKKIYVEDTWIKSDLGDEVGIENGPMDPLHVLLIEKLRVDNVGIVQKIHSVTDELYEKLEGIEAREDAGMFFTHPKLSAKVVQSMLKEIERPDAIIDPYAGGGSLVEQFILKDKMKEFGGPILTGLVNDYTPEQKIILRMRFEKYGFCIMGEDFVDVLMENLTFLKKFKNPLFITNPPFMSSRGREINYGELGDKYGKGNQIYPTIGKLIEIIKHIKCGYLAFFSPFGLFCGRDHFQKLFNALCSNFEFVEGSLWSGKCFNKVSKKKPIVFSVWKFGGKTSIKDIFISFEKRMLCFKRTALLRDGWSYDTQKVIEGEIAIQNNCVFAVEISKFFHVDVERSGSELVPQNLRDGHLKIDKIPSEMIYGLWASCVGRGIIRQPLYMDNAYVHMPDFSKRESIEILVYSLLYAFISKDYTGGKIGFVGARKLMKFGGQRLTDGANYLFETYGDLPVGEQSIAEVLEELRNGRKRDNWKSEVRKEISNRLNEIGYWDCIPLPLKEKSNAKTHDDWKLKKELPTAKVIGEE